MKYHINNNGEVRKCTATKRACIYGEATHFETQAAAQRHLDKQYTKEFGAVARPIFDESEIPAAWEHYADCKEFYAKNRSDVDALKKILDRRRLGLTLSEISSTALDGGTLELEGKAYGDGGSYDIEYDLDVDYAEVKRLAEKLNINLPAMVSYD